MRVLLDGYDLEIWDWVFNFMVSSDLFVFWRVGDKVFVFLDFNELMDDMWDKLMECILFFYCNGVFKNFLIVLLVESYLRWNVVFEIVNIFDYGLIVMFGVYYILWWVLFNSICGWIKFGLINWDCVKFIWFWCFEGWWVICRGDVIVKMGMKRYCDKWL